MLEDVPGLGDALVAGPHEVPHPRLHALLHGSTDLEEDQDDLTGELLANYSKLMGRLQFGKPGKMPAVT